MYHPRPRVIESSESLLEEQGYGRRPSTGNELPSNTSKGTDVEGAGVTGESNSGPGVLGQSIGLTPHRGQDNPLSPPSAGRWRSRNNRRREQSPQSFRIGSLGETQTVPMEFTDQAQAGTGWKAIAGRRPRRSGGQITLGAHDLGLQHRKRRRIRRQRSGIGQCDAQGNLTAKDVLLSGADCAEDFDAPETGDIKAGMVVIFDDDGRLDLSTRPYDKRVAGVISGAGSYKPGVVLDRRPSSRAPESQ